MKGLKFQAKSLCTANDEHWLDFDLTNDMIRAVNGKNHKPRWKEEVFTQ